MTATSVNQQAWAAAADWGSAPRMNELEALMWRSERHPAQSSTLTAVMLLDCVPDWHRLVAAHEWSTTLITRARQRVVQPVLPAAGLPAWVADDHFDLEYHLRRAKLPSGTAQTDLMTFTESFALRPLDRTRPLWEAVLVDNLDGGRAAYILKIHHSLTDGVGGIQLLSSVQSRTREPTPDKPLPQRPDSTDRLASSWQLTVDEISDVLTGIPVATRSVVTMGINALRRPVSTVEGSLRYAASLRRVMAPPAPPSPLLADRTGRQWRFAALECPLEGLRTAAKSAGGSVNDAFIASLLGGLRRYHEKHNVSIEQIPMAMPVSLRKADDPMGGNKFAGAYFAAPVGSADPSDRIGTIHATVQALRREPALDTVSVMAPVFNRAPWAIGALTAQLGTRADISASNFPGVAHETFIAGARVERIFPFGPLPGVAIMATMMSHAGICCIGLNIDGSVVPDCELLVNCISAGFDEVLSVSLPRR